MTRRGADGAGRLASPAPCGRCSSTGIGCLPVVDGDRLVGLLSETDCLRLLARLLAGRRARRARSAAGMTQRCAAAGVPYDPAMSEPAAGARGSDPHRRGRGRRARQPRPRCCARKATTSWPTADGAAAIAALGTRDFDVVLSDLRMPGADGLTVLRHAREIAPQTLVLLMTAHATVDTAVEALRGGAQDYLLKPVIFDDLLHKIDGAASSTGSSPGSASSCAARSSASGTSRTWSASRRRCAR